jgi:hypothetical protein
MGQGCKPSPQWTPSWSAIVEPPAPGFGPFLAFLLIAAARFVATHFIQQWLPGAAPREQ